VVRRQPPSSATTGTFSARPSASCAATSMADLASGEPGVTPGLMARSIARCSASKFQTSMPITAGAK